MMQRYAKLRSISFFVVAVVALSVTSIAVSSVTVSLLFMYIPAYLHEIRVKSGIGMRFLTERWARNFGTRKYNKIKLTLQSSN